MNEYAKISAEKLLAHSAEKTLFLFPVGGLADRGPHLPLGLELFQAEALARRIGSELPNRWVGWSTILMPSVPFAVADLTDSYTLNVRAHVLRDWLVDCCVKLAKIGFRNFLCVSGNHEPRQLTTIEEAGNLVRRRFPLQRIRGPRLLSASSLHISWKEVLSSPLWLDLPEHGGARDTSIGLACCPDLVSPAYKHLAPRERVDSWFARLWSRLLKNRQGYWGTPAEADRETGIRTLQDRCDRIIENLRSGLEGSWLKSPFRTWYSLFPPNRSFFRAWLLAAAILCLTTLWISMGLRYLSR